jgi:hypothetical protein
MAWFTIPRPGTRLGPHRKCQHKDCIEQRTRAEKICPLCKSPIGYDRQVTEDPDSLVLVHFACLQDKIDAEKKGGAA